MKKLFTTFCFLLISYCGNCQSNISGIINNYSPVTSITNLACQSDVTIADTSKFRVGTKVMIIQMKGASINTSNTASYGALTNYNNSGNYEFSYVVARSGLTVSLSPALSRSYTISGLVQLVTVAQYISARVNGTLTCADWDGVKGGILALEVSGNLIVDSNIVATGKGFKGGRVNPNLLVCVNNNEPGYFYNFTSTVAAEKGEGIYIPAAGYESGKGKNMNGGGGGQCKNGGGGGGANAGRGGIGGKGFNVLSNTTIPSGIGADTVSYNPVLNKLFLGGGGGSGHQDDLTPVSSNGADGGGIIFLNALNIIGSGKIISNGDSASRAGSDGAGGGGAGGTIILASTTISSTLSLLCLGGKGGNNNNANSTGVAVSSYCHAPGGGGGGGIVWLSASSSASIAVTGGNAGLTVNVASPCYNTSFGAFNGEAGFVRTDFFLPNIVPGYSNETIRRTLCLGDSFIFQSSYYYRDTTFSDTFVSFGSTCDSVATFVIKFINCDTFSYTLYRNITLCFGDSIQLGGRYRTSAGTYYDSLHAHTFTDTLLITNLSFINCDTFSYILNRNIILCNGDSVRLGGSYRTITGIYYDSLHAHTFTDTLLITNLSFINCDTFSYILNRNIILCDGDSVLIGGSYRTITGIYNDSLHAHTFSDTLLITNLSFVFCDTFSYTLNRNVILCDGDSVLLGGSYRTIAGVYFDSIHAHTFSDTLLITNLSFINCDTIFINFFDSIVLCKGESYYFGSEMITLDGFYTDTIASSTNLDTIKNLYIQFFNCDTAILCSIAVPTAFTPNGDGYNDGFRAFSFCQISNYMIRVFNRWGELVYQSNDVEQLWDGTYRSSSQLVGVYAWTVEGRFDANAQQFFKKGNVTLIK